MVSKLTGRNQKELITRAAEKAALNF